MIMMTLAEISPVASSLLPLPQLKDQLRLPTGIADDGSLDDRLEQSLRAGLAVAEARTGKALFVRQFRWTIESWGKTDRLEMPAAPLVSLDEITLRSAQGNITVLDVADYAVIRDLHNPALLAMAGAFPTLSKGTMVELLFTAGLSATWDTMPADLREAVLIMAVDCFDGNTASTAPAPAVQALLQRYRGLSLGRIGG